MAKALGSADKNPDWTSKVIYDWFSMTSKIHDDRLMTEEIGMDKLNWENCTGVSGYRFKNWFGGVNIHYGAREETWLEMSGSGCRTFETYGNGNYEKLFRLVDEDPDDIHLTRLDIAYDDFDGILDIEQLKKDTAAKKLVCKAHRVFYEKSLDLLDDRKDGLTLQFGSPASDVLIRIYDKRAERLAKLKNENDIQSLIQNCPHWVRVELQLRNERAHAWVHKILHEKRNIGELFAGVIHNYLRFIVEPRSSSDTNRWRWEMKPYWKKFLHGVEQVQLYSKPGTEYNLQHLDHYVCRQAGNAVWTSIKVHGIEKFLEILQEDKPEAVNPKYKRIMDNVELYRKRDPEETEREIRVKTFLRQEAKERERLRGVPAEDLTPEALQRQRLADSLEAGTYGINDTRGFLPNDAEYDVIAAANRARALEQQKLRDAADQRTRKARFDDRMAKFHEELERDLTSIMEDKEE